MNTHNSLKQFHEKEKSRLLFIEATRSGGSVAEYWRQILIVVVFFAAIGGTFASRTQRFRDVLDTLNQDPLKDKRATMRRAVPRPGADPDKFLEDAHAAWADQEGLNDSSKNEDPDDMTEEINRVRKSREALGARLEAVGEGRALPPSPASVAAAMEGRTPPPSEPAIEPEPLPATLLPQPTPAREPSSPAKADQIPAPIIYPAAASAVYQPVKQIPGPYAQEKQEFPDIP